MVKSDGAFPGGNFGLPGRKVLTGSPQDFAVCVRDWGRVGRGPDGVVNNNCQNSSSPCDPSNLHEQRGQLDNVFDCKYRVDTINCVVAHRNRWRFGYYDSSGVCRCCELFV